jgi:multiple sugar transport system substrate-binding protein
MTRHWIFILLLVSVTGCARTEDRGDVDPGSRVRLTYWSAQNPGERKLAKKLVDEWNAAHPDVLVDLQPLPAGQSSEEVLLAAIAAGTTPDVCSNVWPGIVQDFVRADALVPLDRFPDFDSLASSRFPEGIVERFSSTDGRIYQIPWKTNPIMMLYNRKLFREAGITTPPRTYSEYLAAAKKITKDLNGDGQYDRWIGYRDIRPIWHERRFDFFAFYVGASQGQTLFDRGELAVDTVAADKVFAFFQTIYENRYFPLTTFQGSPVLSLKIATEFTGPWQLRWLKDNAPPDLEYGFAPLPRPDDVEENRYTFGDFKSIAIFRNTPHPDEAWAFVKYLITREADLQLLELGGQIPVREGLVGDSLYADFFRREPLMKPFALAAPYSRAVDSISSLQELLDAVAQQFEAAAVYGVYSPQEARKRMIARMKLIRDWES